MRTRTLVAVAALLLAIGVTTSSAYAATVAPSLRATGGDHGVTVSWTKAASSGHILSGQTLRGRAKGTSTWTSRALAAGVTTYPWSNLNNGTTYEFQVVARFSNGSTLASSIVAALPRTIWVKVDSGAGTCALTSLGKVFCWGYGKIGLFSTIDVPDTATPRLVALPKAATDVQAGYAYACALLVDATVSCWGSDDYGQLGRGVVSATRFAPGKVANLSGITSISLGWDHACASSNTASWCWGNNGLSAVGGTDLTVPTPRKVASTLDGPIERTDAGVYNTCGLTSMGTPWCWGQGGTYLNGNLSPVTRSDPQAVFGLAEGVSVPSVGFTHVCTLAQFRLLCWGTASAGESGLTGVVAVQEFVRAADPTVPNFVSIDTGLQFTCGISTSAAVWCFGDNGNGNLGTGDFVSGANARRVLLPSTSSFRQISLGRDSACAIDSGGALYCWGYNVTKAVSAASTPSVAVPVPISRKV